MAERGQDQGQGAGQGPGPGPGPGHHQHLFDPAMLYITERAIARSKDNKEFLEYKLLTEKANAAIEILHHDTSDLTKYFSDKINLKELNFPHGLRQRNLPEAVIADHVEAQLKGLPGALQLDYCTTQKYFGEQAKERFYGRLKWLEQQKNITATSSNSDLTKLYFESEKFVDFEGIPFGPVRKDLRESSSTQSRPATVASTGYIELSA